MDGQEWADPDGVYSSAWEDPLALMLFPGLTLLPIAILLGLLHLTWALQTSRRAWVLKGIGAAPRLRAPSERERLRLANTTRALVAIAMLSPGLGYLVPPLFAVVFAGLRVERQTTRLLAADWWETKRVDSVGILATLGVMCGVVYLGGIWMFAGEVDGGLISASLLWGGGLLGLLAIARQFVVIRAIDIAGHLAPAETEEALVS